ncbi:hypothetical protein KCU96_g7, partial [Aureobasidium melanogenum]
MTQFMTQCTALNPPVLETYSTSYSLIERRQFTDMIQLANHILFLGQMQTQPDLAGQVQSIIENWVLRGDPMPNQFIYETAELFASVGYRFRVRCRNCLRCYLRRLSHSTRLYLIHTLGNEQLRRPSIYKKEPKTDLDCIGCPTCNFCTKVKKDMLKHEAQHWDDPHPCICAQLDPKVMAKEIDTKVCHCGRLAIDENDVFHKFGMSETMPTFANVTAIQMQRDVIVPKMEQYLNINSGGWS